jgi:hypothetical protein
MQQWISLFAQSESRRTTYRGATRQVCTFAAPLPFLPLVTNLKISKLLRL